MNDIVSFSRSCIIEARKVLTLPLAVKGKHFNAEE